MLHLAASPELQLSKQLALLFRSWMGERLANSCGLAFHQGSANVQEVSCIASYVLGMLMW